MVFSEITELEFKNFLDNHDQKTFLQTPQIGNLRKSSGWDIYFVGIKKEEKLVGASMVVAKKEFMNKKEFYAPRGLLTDYNDIDSLSFFVLELVKFIKKRKGFILRIDPYVVNKERDINGDIVRDGQNNQQAVINIKALGFIEKKPEQSKWMFTLDIKNKTMDDLLKQMRPNTRNCINKTFKYGINIRELNYDELKEFADITDTTSQRRHFDNKPIGYYQFMYNAFYPSSEIKYLLAEMDTNKYLKQVKEELIIEKEKLKKLKLRKAKIERLNEQESAVKTIGKRIEEAKELVKKGDFITLSASMFMLYGKEIVYLVCGNYKDYLHFFAQYRIQYEMIKYGIEHQFDIYNFYGISGNFNKKDEKYGVYDFKKGFNGKVVELIGEYAFPVNKPVHMIYTIYNKIKQLIKIVKG